MVLMSEFDPNVDSSVEIGVTDLEGVVFLSRERICNLFSLLLAEARSLLIGVSTGLTTFIDCFLLLLVW